MKALNNKKLTLLIAAAMILPSVSANAVALSDNIYFITEQIIVPKGDKKGWQWDGLESIDYDTSMQNQARATNKYSSDKSKYYLTRFIVGNKSIKVEGSKTAPEVVKFNSGRADDKGLWQLKQIVNPANVTKLKSNCNFKDVTVGGGESKGDSGKTLEYQNFYKWQREDSQPLYIAESKGDGYILTSVYNAYNWQNYMIVRDPKVFNKYEVWNTDKNGKKVTCRFG